MESKFISAAYQKILVIGSPGSGKTTFSQKLAMVLDLPVIHLDDEYWLPNWQRPKDTIWKKHLNNLLNQEKWIIEGNYVSSFNERLKYCDCVILINEVTSKCLWRVFLRAVKRFSGETLSLPKNVKTNLYKQRLYFPIKFILLILTYRWRIIPKMKLAINAANIPILIVNNKKQIWCKNADTI